MGKGYLTISIDFELAWGVWDIVTREDLAFAETAERPICAALIELFDRYDVAVTWAMVAAILDRSSSKSLPGREACWYAPDIVEGIVTAKVAHEIGSHSGRHVYFDQSSVAAAADDLEFARDVHHRNGLSFRSFVYPRNGVGHLDLLPRFGIASYRGPDGGWVDAAGRLGSGVRRIVNLLDKALPVSPQPVHPMNNGTLTDVPGSTQILARNGLRRFILPPVTQARLRRGLERACQAGAVFHLWFHPSNFYFRTDEQIATLSDFLEHAAAEAARGRIEIRTMGSWASSDQAVAATVQ